MKTYPKDLNETLTDSITFSHTPYRPNNSKLFDGDSTASVPAEVGEMIRLYVPNSTPGMSQSNSWGKVDFEGELGQVRLNAIRAVTNSISGLGGQGSLSKEIEQIGETAGETFKETLNSAVPALKQAGISFVAERLGVSGSQALAVSRGQVYNPNVELLYNSPQLRQFTFEFNFIPKNKRESREIDDIIFEFKSYSAPKDPGGTEGVFCVPHIWNVVYSGLSAKKMAKFKPAALTNVVVQENSTSPTHTTFDDGTPVVTTMVLTFKEVNIITRKDHRDAKREGFRRGY